MKKALNDILNLAVYDTGFIRTLLMVVSVSVAAAFLGDAPLDVVIALLVVGCVTAVIEFRAHAAERSRD